MDPSQISAAGFRRSSVAAILVAADAPRWTILDASDAYSAVTHHSRETLIGRPMFEAFPESEGTTAERGASNVQRSFELAIATRDTVILPVQRYDLASAAGDRAFEARYWQLSTRPLIDDAGQVFALLHEVVNVTERIRSDAERSRLETTLAARNEMLVEQTQELESTNARLQENAIELEDQAEELQATAAQLEERTAQAERATRAAEAAERQLQSTFMHAPVGIAVLYGPEHTYTLANPIYTRLAGGRPLVGRTIRDAFPDLAHQGIYELLDQVFRTGERFLASEIRLLLQASADAAPQERILDFVYEPIKEAGGRTTGIVVVATDVTAHVVARDQIANAERQIRRLADAIPTLAWTARPDGYIDWYNARWYEYTGTTAADMEGWGWQSVHDPEILPAVLEQWTGAIRTGQPFEMTFPIKGADGRFRQFLTRVVPITDAEKHIVRWFGTNTDVDSERRALDAAEHARRDLNRVFMQAPAAIAVVRGPLHVFEIANPLYEQLVGRTGIVGLTVRSALGELEGQGIFELMDEVYSTGVAHVGNETHVVFARGPGGEAVAGYFNFVFQPIVNDEGYVDGIAIVATEVTQQVAARMESERLRTAAESANKAKAEFLASMSHELRTPLNAIGGYAELLEMGIRGDLTEEQRKDIGRIRSSQRYLLSLVNDVLNFARLEAGRVEFTLAPVGVAELFAEVEPLVAPQLTGRELSFTCTAGPPTLVVNTDREKARQILLNLLSNATKFTEPGGTVALAAEDGVTAVRMSVTDSGIGIPSERLNDIFEPFVQLDRTLSNPGEGTGLGLAISRDLARAMGGDLTVQSAVGQGSTFVLSLPRTPA